MIIDDIDFGALYKKHLSNRKERRHKNAQDWDQKSNSMAIDLGGDSDPYVKAFIEKMDFNGVETLLDVGCGPGTICLPIAQHFKDVYALDFSQGMLTKLQEVAQAKQIDNVHCVHQAWEDDWDEVPMCDVIVVSRASIVKDLHEAVLKLNSKAKQRIYTTQIVDHHFIKEEILSVLSRKKENTPNYIYLVNILQQMGYRPHVDYIDTPLNKPQPEHFEELLQHVEWSIGTLTAEEKRKLRTYFDERKAKGLPVAKTSRAWAFVWWEVSTKV